MSSGDYQRPKGTRDFLPDEMALRRRVIESLRTAFQIYGYGEVDSPAFENFATLARKSGPEIEKEIYCFEDKGGRKLGLIFEFTASLARVVANNPQLVFPFKRYAIGKVWRYERPQSSRYREFVQADVDIVGSPSMDCEAELMCLTCDVLKALELPNYRIHLNNRKILEAQATVANIKDEHVPDALRALDKFFKIGRDGVQNEFLSRGMSLDDFDRFMDLIYAAEDSLPNADNEDNNPDSRYANRLRLEMTRKALESSA